MGMVLRPRDLRFWEHLEEYCPNCGRRLFKRTNFCPHCGYHLGGGERDRRPPWDPIRPRYKPIVYRR